MSDTPQKTVVLCQDMLCVLGEDLTLANGQVLPKGTRALVLPQTIAACILTPEGTSLAEAWPSLSRAGHEHQSVVDLGTELARQNSCIIELSEKIIRNSNNIAAATTELEAIKELLQAARNKSSIVVDSPRYQLPIQIENTGEIAFSVSANSLLNNGKVVGFRVDCPALDVHGRYFTADETESAQIGIEVYPFITNQEIEVWVTALDHLGNNSLPVLRKTLIVKDAIAAPSITSPLNGDVVGRLDCPITVAPMQLIGDFEDTAQYIRIQIASDRKFQNILYDAGITSAVPDDLTVTVPVELPANSECFARARWTGYTHGQSVWSETISFMTGE